MHFFRGGGAKAPGTVAFWSPWHFCSPLRYRNSHWQFLHTRNNGANGQNGRMWLIDSGLDRDE